MKPESVIENHLRSACSKCQGETSLEDRFCQDCGHPLPVADVPAVVRSPALWPTSRNDGIEPVDVPSYYSTLEPEAQPKRRWFSMALNPNSAKPAVQLPIVILTLIVLAATPFFVITIANSYDSFSEKFICDHACELLNKGNFLEAVEDMQRLYMDRGGRLKGASLSLLARALIARSDDYLSKKSVPSAMKDLRDVPPDLPESKIAAAKLKTLQDAFTINSSADTLAPGKVPVAVKVQATPRAQTSSKSRILETNAKIKSQTSVVATRETVKSTVPPPPPDLDTTSASCADNSDALAKPAESGVGAGSSRKVQFVSDDRIKAANSALIAESLSHSKDEPNLGKTKGKVKPAPTFAADDVARYNELLAGYFSQDRHPHNGSAVAQDPPSFKEWIGSGKPDFR